MEGNLYLQPSFCTYQFSSIKTAADHASNVTVTIMAVKANVTVSNINITGNINATNHYRKKYNH